MPSGVYKRKPMSEETKQKIKKNRKGKGLGREGFWKGKKHTDTYKKKMSDKLKGRKITWKDKISEGQKKLGVKHWAKRKDVREKMSKAKLGKRGELSGGWKGGKMSLYPELERLRKSLEYKLWRKAVFERDKYTCIWCGKKDETIQADHIKPFCNYPELRFAIDNGRTLCLNCHKTTDTYGGRSNKRN